MDLKLLNTKIIEFLENPVLKSNDFDNFSKLLMNKELVLHIKEIILIHLENVKSNEKNMLDTSNLKIGNREIRKFMSVFLFVYFPEIHRLEKRK